MGIVALAGPPVEFPANIGWLPGSKGPPGMGIIDQGNAEPHGVSGARLSSGGGLVFVVSAAPNVVRPCLRALARGARSTDESRGPGFEAQRILAVRTRGPSGSGLAVTIGREARHDGAARS